MILIPRGQIDLSERARGLDDLTGDRWPDGLRICAVRRSDGARVAFGRPGAPATRLAHAVLASCAIPGYFRPVTIDGAEYLDGGIYSATNADVLKRDNLNLVVIVSSLSAPNGNANGLDGFVRRAVHQRMKREIARLQEAGTAVISLEPRAASRRAMGLHAMAENRGPRIVEVAYEETRTRILTSPILAAMGVTASGPATAAG
jgi:NTE family protein